MYDFPFLAWANDALWAGLADRLRAAGLPRVPHSLDRTRAPARIWSDPDLLLAQTCGYPLVTSLRGAARVVLTPCYDLPGCDGAWHRSLLVVRADEPAEDLAALRGRRCAFNGRDSNSGMNVLRAAVAPLAGGATFFGVVTETGAHVESLRAVREGRADVAAIDCVTHGLIGRHLPSLLGGTRVIGATPASPGLPLITAPTAADAEVARLRAVLWDVMADPALAAARAAVGWRDLALVEADDYAVVAGYERAAVAAGYPELA